MSKYLSRKFIVTILVMLLSVAVPLLYKNNGVSDTAVLAVLGFLASIGAAYHVANIKDPNKQ